MVKNKEIFYKELRNSINRMREQSNNTMDTIQILTKSSVIALHFLCYARKEGLLFLEEAARIEKVEEHLLGNELLRMIDLVINGTDPEIIEDVCMKRYYANDYSALESFVFLFYMDAMLDLQAGLSPVIVEESIKSYMPDQVVEQLKMIKKEEEKQNIIKSEDSWEKLYGRKFPFREAGSEYYIIRIVDYCVISMSNEDLQRLLRDVRNIYLIMLLKGLSGKAVKKIHDNISHRLDAMLMEDMESMGIVSSTDIADVAGRVFQIMLKLGKETQIKIPGGLDSIFEPCGIKEKAGQEYSLIRSCFLGMTNRDIQRVLKDIPQNTLSIAMIGWTTELRRIICENLSRPAAARIKNELNYYEYYGCTEKQIEEANEKVLTEIQKLEDCAEIFIWS